MKFNFIYIYLSAYFCASIAGDFLAEEVEIQKWEDYKVSFELLIKN